MRRIKKTVAGERGGGRRLEGAQAAASGGAGVSPSVRDLLLALLLPFLALGLQWVLWPWISPFVWFMFFPAVFLSARLAGLWGGLASTLLSAGLVWYVFIPPQLSWDLKNPANFYSVGLFLVMGYLFSESQERLRRAQRRTEEVLAETRAANVKITQLYEQMKALDKLKTQFFATVSHELRTPLTLILGPVGKRLASGDLETAERQELEVVERNARLLYRHVTDLLDAARAEAGRLDLHATTLDLVPLVRSVAANFEVMAKEKGIQLQLTTPAALPIQVDADKVQRILLNLLSNAFKLTPDGGSVAVRLREEAEQAILSVEDTGPGVPPEWRELIFEPFRQGEGGATRRHGGTGLGLFIVKELVALHGGSVAVTDAPGGGALFRVSFPRTPAPSAAAPLMAPASELDPQLRRPALEELRAPVPVRAELEPVELGAPWILVVEDNPDMSAYVAGALSKQYRVITVGDGQEGLERALAERPDLILSDVMMPVMNGDTMALALRERPETRDIPILMLTAKADDALRLRLLQAGVQDYLLKPFAVDELLARIATILGERRKVAERLREAEASLADSERRYRELVQSANSVIIIWSPDGTITFFNKYAQILFGWSAEEAVGKPVSLLVPERESNGKDLTGLVEDIAAHPERYQNHVNENICRDGRRLWVSWTNRALRDAQGRVTGILAIGNDITALRHAELALRQSEARIRFALESSGMGAWDLDLDDQSANRTPRHDAIFGYRELLPEWTYEMFLDHVLPEDREGVDEKFRRAVANGEDWGFECRIRRADGETRWIWASGRHSSDASGQRRRMAGVVQDITERKQAELALRESEQRLRLAQDAAKGGTWEWDLRTNRNTWSEEVFRLYGLDPGACEPSYEAWLASIHPEDRARAAATVLAAAREGAELDTEWRVNRGGAAERWLLSRGQPQRDAAGRVVRYVGIVIDISERKRAERAVAESERRFRSLFDQAAVGMAILAPEGRWLEVNDRLCAILGYDPAELMGLDSQHVVHPDHLAEDALRLAAMIAGERDSDAWDERYLRKDGRVIWVHITSRLTRDADGRPQYFVTVTEDITEKMRLSEELQAHQNHLEELVQVRSAELLRQGHSLQALIDNLPHMAWLKDSAGRFLAVNRVIAASNGLQPADLIGKTDFDLWPREMAEHYWADDLEVMASRRQKTVVESVATQAGTRYETFKAPIIDADGSVLGTVGFARDIKPQLDMEAELARRAAEAEAATQAKSAFLANMSHEIRTPMNAVLGLAYLLEQQALPEEARALAHKIQQAGRTLLGIINDILDFSKIESGRIEIERVPFRLGEVLDNLATIMRTSAAGKPIDLAIRPPEGLDPTLLGDPLRLGQILINLTSNAIKFTPEGVVEVRIDPIDQAPGDHGPGAQGDSQLRLRFSVRDTGIGMDTETQARLFQPFSQADASTTRRFGGTGLGLVICRRLVELMGGHLGLTSTLGEGSIFWVELSFELAAAAADRHRQIPPLRVLVVDDNPIVREAAVATVEALGWTAVQAASGREALSRVVQETALQGPDAVVLLDWRMPELDGLATARAIREALPAPSQPSLFLFTAHPLEEAQRLPGVDAVDGVLAKPLAPSPLYDAVRLEHRRRRGQPERPSARVQTRRLQGVRLLVVDDSDINREVAERIFSAEGAEVRLANDGREALDWLTAHPAAVDLVLMDVHMPVMDGRTATRLIRAVPALARLPIVALTADALGGRERAALEAGMDAFLAKPFDVPRAVALIRSLTGCVGEGRADPHLLEGMGTLKAAGAETLAGETAIEVGQDPSADAVDTELPGLELDRAQALWGDLDVYRRYLRRFAASYAEAAGMLATAAPEEARQLAHKLKGTAGNLGLVELSACAEELERALASGALAEREALTAVLAQTLQTALTSIRRFAPEAEAATVDTRAPGAGLSEQARVRITQPLARVLAAFEQFDPMTAGAILRELGAELSPEQLAPALRAVEDFDAAGGVEALRALAAELGIEL